jgi:hypothetical protein
MSSKGPKHTCGGASPKSSSEPGTAGTSCSRISPARSRRSPAVSAGCDRSEAAPAWQPTGHFLGSRTRLVTARFSARSARAAGARCTARAIRSWAALSRRRFCPPSASGRPSAAPVRPRGANARLTQRPRRRQGGRPPVRARMSPDGVWSSRGIRPRSQTSRRPEESQPLMFAPRAAVMLHHIDRRFLPAEHRW